MRRFHARRLLRTLPLYHALFLTAALLNIGHVRDGFWWHGGFVSNLYFNIYRPPFSAATHLWSLAVQEQFYLLWPCVIFFVPQRLLFIVTLVSFVVDRSAAWRSWPWARRHSFFFPFGCLDTLSGGALLVVLADRRIGSPELRKTVVCWCLRLGVPGFVLLLILNAHHPHHRIFWIWSDTALALLFIWLVDAAARSTTGLVGSVLDARVVRYVGGISFGI